MSRRCHRRLNTHHGVNNKGCDCLRVELPVEARAKSSGALATPDRNHTCGRCGGSGQSPLMSDGISLHVEACSRCSGSGELKADGTPGGRVASDRFIRARLSSARESGTLGRKS